MDDLHVPAGPGIPRGLSIPAGELVEQFSRSSGPGGQNVNSADSRVQLSLDLATTSVLTEDQREQVLARLSSRISGTVLTVSAEDQRAQLRNRTAARRRLAELLREALAPEVVRKPSRPSRNSRRRRVARERRRSEIKQNRRRPRAE